MGQRASREALSKAAPDATPPRASLPDDPADAEDDYDPRKPEYVLPATEVDVAGESGRLLRLQIRKLEGAVGARTRLLERKRQSQEEADPKHADMIGNISDNGCADNKDLTESGAEDAESFAVAPGAEVSGGGTPDDILEHYRRVICELCSAEAQRAEAVRSAAANVAAAAPVPTEAAAEAAGAAAEEVDTLQRPATDNAAGARPPRKTARAMQFCTRLLEDRTFVQPSRACDAIGYLRRSHAVPAHMTFAKTAAKPEPMPTATAQNPVKVNDARPSPFLADGSSATRAAFEAPFQHFTGQCADTAENEVKGLALGGGPRLLSKRAPLGSVDYQCCHEFGREGPMGQRLAMGHGHDAWQVTCKYLSATNMTESLLGCGDMAPSSVMAAAYQDGTMKRTVRSASDGACFAGVQRIFDVFNRPVLK